MITTPSRLDPPDIAATRPRLSHIAGILVLAHTAAATIIFSAPSTPWTVRLERAGWLVLAATLLWALWRRGSRTLTAIGNLAVGIAASVVGAAITLPHIISTGLTPLHLAGLVAFAAGLTLTTLGTRQLTRPIKKRWRRYLTVAAGSAAALYLIAPVAFAVYVTNPPPTAACCRTPATLGLTYQDIRLTTSDGIQLAAWYLPSHNGAAVILLHGSGESREATLDHAALLAHHGYGTLMLDARGHGNSAGRALDLGWAGAKDIDAAVTYLIARPDITAGRIAVLGLSLGAEEALTAAAQDPRILAVVAEGAGMRTFGDARVAAAGTTASGPTGILALPAEWISFAAARLLTNEQPPIPLQSATRRITPRPVLLISGSDQQEADLNRAYAAAGGPTTHWWALPDTAHTKALTTHPAPYQQRVLSFLDTALLSTQGSPAARAQH
jgi:uncharacterized protein